MTDRETKSAVKVFVALLRGVNVGGKNMLGMRPLKASFERMGFREVTTYINSGNVVFKTKEGDARKLESRIERMLSREYRLECKVVVRSFSEMARLVEGLPEGWGGDPRWKYNVIFLRRSIDSEDILSGLQPRRGIEQVAYRQGALLWSVLAGDAARTAMVRLPGQKVYQEMTVRNLNTTRKLYELMKRMAED
jgi:uncharacterized protein (DUF1697 family)